MTMSAYMSLVQTIKHQRSEAERKAIDALAGYKFWMFGYWAAAWVKNNRLLPKPMQAPNPFRELVLKAREMRGD